MLGEVSPVLSMSEFDFQPYLSAIVAHYAKDHDLSQPTDAILPLRVRSVVQENHAVVN
jgi:hypothetical protein